MYCSLFLFLALKLFVYSSFAVLFLDILSAGVHVLCPQVWVYQVYFGPFGFILKFGFVCREIWIYNRLYRGWNFLSWIGEICGFGVCFGLVYGGVDWASSQGLPGLVLFLLFGSVGAGLLLLVWACMLLWGWSVFI
ncbi:hypothetical protein R6Q59_009292 [Mikania micrantha]